MGAEGLRLGVVRTLLTTSMRSQALQVLNVASDLGVTVRRQVWTSTLGRLRVRVLRTSRRNDSTDGRRIRQPKVSRYTNTPADELPQRR